MKNKLTDLNNHLFAQLEILSDEELTDEELETEIKRAKAITSIASNIISNAAIGLEVTKLVVEYGHREVVLPEAMRIENAKK